MVQLYSLYKYAKITGLTVIHKITNNSTNPLAWAIGVIPFNEFTVGFAPQTLSETPRGKLRIVGPSTGTCVSSLSDTYSAETMYGQPVQSSQYWIDATQAASTIPVSTLEPTHVVSITQAVGGTYSYYLETRLEYHVQFFDLRANQL
jgi:hypothetical protein